MPFRREGPGSSSRLAWLREAAPAPSHQRYSRLGDTRMEPVRFLVLEKENHLGGGQAARPEKVLESGIAHRPFYCSSSISWPSHRGDAESRPMPGQLAESTGFVSYARRDEAFVRRLVADLALHGVQVWYGNENESQCGRTPIVAPWLHSSPSGHTNLRPVALNADASARPRTTAFLRPLNGAPALQRGCSSCVRSRSGSTQSFVLRPPHSLE